MDKRWYRLTLDVAYEGPILDKNGQAVEAGSLEALEILERVCRLDVSTALRASSAGPVDWHLEKVEYVPSLAREKNVEARRQQLRSAIIRAARNLLVKSSGDPDLCPEWEELDDALRASTEFAESRLTGA
jgi:hypothetical protein